MEDSGTHNGVVALRVIFKVVMQIIEDEGTTTLGTVKLAGGTAQFTTSKLRIKSIYSH